MNNIHEILKGMGIEVPEDKKADFDKELAKNYKTVAEVQKKDEQINNLTGQLNTVNESLKKFDGVDVEGMKSQITKLTGDLTAQQNAYNQKLSDMEFDHLLDGAITGAKGKNSKAIKALLDIDGLKKSTDRSKDIAAAVSKVKEENGYMFDTEAKPSPYASGTGTGAHGGKASKWKDPTIAAFAAGAGLKDEEE